MKPNEHLQAICSQYKTGDKKADMCVSKGGDTLSTSKGFKPIGSNSNYPNKKTIGCTNYQHWTCRVSMENWTEKHEVNLIKQHPLESQFLYKQRQINGHDIQDGNLPIVKERKSSAGASTGFFFTRQYNSFLCVVCSTVDALHHI